MSLGGDSGTLEVSEGVLDTRSLYYSYPEHIPETGKQTTTSMAATVETPSAVTATTTSTIVGSSAKAKKKKKASTKSKVMAVQAVTAKKVIENLLAVDVFVECLLQRQSRHLLVLGIQRQ